jgi:hypothetical protein
MDIANLPVGQATERSGDGRQHNAPGVYFDKLSETTMTTVEGSEGVIQADAFVRLGYEYVGPPPTRQEVLASTKAQLIKDTKAEKAEKDAFEADIKKAKE